MTATIHVFGDSHSALFQPTANIYRRLGVERSGIRVKGEAIAAASVAGFRPKTTTLKTKEIIKSGVSDAEYVALAFGQVDLELGYYYRRIVKREDVEPEGYAKWLVGIYIDFLKSIDLSGKKVALKGVNLTTLTQKNFFARYVSRIIGKSSAESEGAMSLVMREVLGENRQNKMHLVFNDLMSAEAKNLGFLYFDVNGYICRRDMVTGVPHRPLRISPHFQPGNFDHHLVDSLTTRAIHLDALASVFGLQNSLPDSWML